MSTTDTNDRRVEDESLRGLREDIWHLRARALDLALGLDLARARDRDLALALARAFTLARDLGLALTRAFDRDRDLVRDRDLGHALARALDCAHAVDRARDLALTHTRALDYAHARARALALARALDYVLPFIDARLDATPAHVSPATPATRVLDRAEWLVRRLPPSVLDPRVVDEELGDMRELLDARLANGEREIKIALLFLLCALVSLWNTQRVKLVRLIEQRQAK